MRLASVGRWLLRPATNKTGLTSQNDFFFVPGMLLATMDAGHCSGLHLGGGKDIFFNHHSSHVKFFRYRTSHQDSLDHVANISHPGLNSLLYLGPKAWTLLR